MATGTILSRSRKLNNSDEYKQIHVRRNMSEDERMRGEEILNEAKRRNDKRSEENNFWRKIKNKKLKKWWIDERM